MADNYFDSYSDSLGHIPLRELFLHYAENGKVWGERETAYLNERIEREAILLNEHSNQVLDEIETVYEEIPGYKDGLNYNDLDRTQVDAAEASAEYLRQDVQKARTNLYDEVYAVQYFDFSQLNDEFRRKSGFSDNRFYPELISQSTLLELGSDYTAFCERKGKLDMNRDAGTSQKFPSFNKKPVEAVVPAKKSVQAERPISEKAEELYNSFQNGVSNPDYDFDEYDRD